MNPSFLLPWIVFAGIAGTLLFKRLKYGSWTGAFVNAKIERTVGEVELGSSLMRQKLQVHAMEVGQRPDEKYVGLTITTKTFLSAGMMPFKLTRQQALELAAMLQQAAR
jgi:hypothetical protein